ncbi:hypothetical protein N7468_007326 [Penicillium chermesinum]|uniref:Uncharacterized protein n=1 Tax=Penicillium chermesinum TaxID=63820 RepID=A0A9W9TKG7_9EURO|nr:uncharacterized protein N7468_007326 [Penicillium chermesinum]KAJ5226101.1 hypothetical protein N7468_007326 [Penicillium chermesinum]
MGEVLGLQQQKTSAEQKYMERADEAAGNAKPVNAHGEPTCAAEDHTFMEHKPGGSGTLPGWETMKNVLGGHKWRGQLGSG